MKKLRWNIGVILLKIAYKVRGKIPQARYWWNKV
jgi:hypothetical protein